MTDFNDVQASIHLNWAKHLLVRNENSSTLFPKFQIKEVGGVSTLKTKLRNLKQTTGLNLRRDQFSQAVLKTWSMHDVHSRPNAGNIDNERSLHKRGENFILTKRKSCLGAWNLKLLTEKLGNWSSSPYWLVKCPSQGGDMKGGKIIIVFIFETEVYYRDILFFRQVINIHVVL